MRIPLKLVGVMLVLGAPAPALAQSGLTAVGQAAGQVASQARTQVAAQPIRMTSHHPVNAAAFRVLPSHAAQRGLKMSVRGDDKVAQDIELRQKDEWTDDEGFRFNFTKLGYKSRF